MSKHEEQYREHLDGFDYQTLLGDRDKAAVLEEVDPIAYRVGLADFVPTCESCGDEPEAGWDEDSWDGLCEDCRAEEEED